MERLTLPLNNGITGVVGPNGCGKSNVVDAIRWVLGENNARNLRGTVSEDVIFNGTEKLRPLGLAEVTITLKAAGEDFFSSLNAPSLEAESLSLAEDIDAALEEAKVKLEVVANESEPEITEGETVPANADAAIESETEINDGKPKLTVIEGRKGEVEKVSPSATDALTQRFSWLKSVSEVQLTRRLYRSGESEYFINRVPCRLRDIVDLCRASGLGARTYTIVAQGQVARIVSAKPEERRMILEEAAGVVGFKDKIAAANRRLKETDINIDRLNDVITEVTRNVGSLSRQASRAKNRERLKSELNDLLKTIYADKYLELHDTKGALSKQLTSEQENESLSESELQRVQASEMEARSNLMGVDVETDGIRAKIDAIREELSTRERARHQRGSRLSELGVLCSTKLAEKRENEERVRVLDERSKSASSSIETLKTSETSIQEQIATLETGRDEEIRSINAELQRTREILRAKEREIMARRDELVASKSIAQSVEEQIRSASPEEELKRTIGDQYQSLATGAVGLFVDGLEVAHKYVRAVQAVVAEKAAYLVTEDPESMAKAFSQGDSAGESRFKGRALGLFKASSQALESAKSDVTGVTPLLSLISVKDSHRFAAQSLLANVFFAETIAAAYEFLNSDSAPKDAVLVTERGEIISTYSFSSIQLEGGLLQLKAKLEDLRLKIEQDEKVQSGLNSERENFVAQIAELERKLSEALRRSEERAAKIRELSHEQGSLRGRLDAESRLNQQTAGDLSAVKNQIISLERDLNNLEAEQSELRAQLASDVGDEERELESRLIAFKAEAERLTVIRDAGREELSKLATMLADQRTRLDRARAAVSQANLEMQRAELEVSHLKERLSEELGEGVWGELNARGDMGSLGARLTTADRQSKEEELQKLKARIQREGDVDPTSIERYDEESKRLENLELQKSDLEQASTTLKKTIKRLSELSEQRFVETFKAVNENFGKLVPRLYGGGSAKLELLDPSNPLESGVDIIIRPPGKKLKNIELLSGGEKALCAISLIVAMFLERPSPLCVLDEVDAPLDDANVVRFATLVKDMSNKTQFIVITHNKQTMQICDRLVGVTMQEPGASRVVTVSLEEAYSHAGNE